MQCVRPDDLFCLLADFSVFSGQQLRTDGCVQNIAKHLPKRAAFSFVRHGGDDMPNERLGDRGVYAVHTHMVAVIGGPAQRQL